jgi:hypothetical protein
MQVERGMVMRSKRTLTSMGAVLVLGALLAFYARANPLADPPQETTGDACTAAYPLQGAALQPETGLASPSSGQGPAMADLAVDQPAIPPIDARAPAHTEIATFALG